MASFADLIEKIVLERENSEDARDSEQETADSALMGDKAGSSAIQNDDVKADEVIRSGLNLNPNFWQDFIKIANNSDGLANLLRLEPDAVSQWGGIIEEKLKKVQNNDSNESKKTTMLPTGNSIGEE